MSTAIVPEAPASHEHPEPEEHLSYLKDGYSIWSWLFTVDHKRIGVLYLVFLTIFFAIGGTFAGLVRLNLISPHGAIMDNDTYNKTFTAHGVVMLFLFLIPSIPGMMGNFFVPIMIGAKDMAFPKLNIASWYVWMIGAGFAIWALLAGGHRYGVDPIPALFQSVDAYQRRAGRVRRVHHGLLVDHDGARTSSSRFTGCAARE